MTLRTARCLDIFVDDSRQKNTRSRVAGHKGSATERDDINDRREGWTGDDERLPTHPETGSRASRRREDRVPLERASLGQIRADCRGSPGDAARRGIHDGDRAAATRASDSGGDLDVDDDRLEARGVPDAFTSGSAASSSESRFVQKGFDAGRRARPLGGFDGDDDDESDAPIARRPRVKPDAPPPRTGRTGSSPRGSPSSRARWTTSAERWRSMRRGTASYSARAARSSCATWTR